MNYWFLTILLMAAVEIGMISAKNGQPRKDNYSVGISIVSYALYIFLVVKAIQTGF